MLSKLNLKYLSQIIEWANVILLLLKESMNRNLLFSRTFFITTYNKQKHFPIIDLIDIPYGLHIGTLQSIILLRNLLQSFFSH